MFLLLQALIALLVLCLPAPEITPGCIIRVAEQHIHDSAWVRRYFSNAGFGLTYPNDTESMTFRQGDEYVCWKLQPPGAFTEENYRCLVYACKDADRTDAFLAELLALGYRETPGGCSNYRYYQRGAVQVGLSFHGSFIAFYVKRPAAKGR